MSKRARKEKVIRRSLELHPKTADRLARLREALEATSDTEVFRRALEVLEALLLSEGDQGTQLFVKERDGTITRVSMRYSGIATDVNTIMRRPLSS